METVHDKGRVPILVEVRTREGGRVECDQLVIRGGVLSAACIHFLLTNSNKFVNGNMVREGMRYKYKPFFLKTN